jgi:3-oxoadipyl-CoA thiolase
MGLGPVPAIRKLLTRLDLTLKDFDHIEINEAFAVQVLACARQLGLADDEARLNPYGGAIAYGHPLGASGGRLLGVALAAMEKQQTQRALLAMCIGVGQGIALAIERV